MGIKYVDEIKKITKLYFEELEALKIKEENLKTNKSMYSKEHYSKELEKIKGAKVVLNDVSLISFVKMKESFNKDVDSWVEPKGENLDSEDLKLLQGYITLSENEVQNLAEKHKKNNLMTRALKEYADKNNLYLYLETNEEDIRNQFEQIEAVFRRMLNDSEGYSAKLLKTEDFLNGVEEKFSLLEKQEV